MLSKYPLKSASTMLRHVDLPTARERPRQPSSATLTRRKGAALRAVPSAPRILQAETTVPGGAVTRRSTLSRVFTTPDAKLLEQASRHVRTLMANPLPSALRGNWDRASGPHSSSPDSSPDKYVWLQPQPLVQTGHYRSSTAQTRKYRRQPAPLLHRKTAPHIGRVPGLSEPWVGNDSGRPGPTHATHRGLSTAEPPQTCRPIRRLA
jgi:hypothetical protein